MSKKTALFDLIKALEPSEKGFFKRYARMENAPANLPAIQLFDAIARQKTYNEEKLRPLFPDDIPFSKRKKYLYDLLLDTLEDYHQKRHAKFKMHKWLGQFWVLYQKELYAQATDLAKKALNFSLTQGFKEYELLFYEMLSRVCAKTKQPLENCPIEQFPAKIEQTLNAYLDQIEWTNISIKKSYLRKKEMSLGIHSPQYSTIKALLKNKSEKNCYTSSDLAHFYQAQLKMAELEGNHDQQLYWAKKNLEVKSDFSSSGFVNLSSNYIIACQNILYHSVVLNRWEEMPLFIEKIRATPKHPGIKNLEAIQFHADLVAGAYEYPYFFYADKKEACLKSMAQYWEFIRENEKKVEPVWQVFIPASMSLYYWHFGKTEQAEDKLNFLFNTTDSNIQPRFQMLGRLAFLGMHLEKGNHVLVENRLPEALRYLRTKKIKNDLPKIQLSAIQQMLHAPTPKKQQEAINQFEKKSSILIKDIKTPFMYRDAASVFLKKFQ